MSVRLAIILCASMAACALSLSAWLPLQAAIAGAGVAVVLAGVALQRTASRRYSALVARLEAMKGVRTRGRLGTWDDPGQRIAAVADTLVDDLEESYYRLIRTNIQLLSLKEVGRSIIASLDRDRTVQSVLEYLHRGVGFQEYGLFTWQQEDGVFAGGVRRRAADGHVWVPMRFALPETSGVLAKALGNQRSMLIKDAATHDLGTLQGEPLFLPCTSYAVVPLVASPPLENPWDKRGCDPGACPAAPASRVTNWYDKFADEPDASFWDGGRFRCWSCAGMPLLGCLVVTDAGRDAPLSKVDLIMLETLAQNLATVLENARLYEDLRREERFREHVFQSLSDGLLTCDLHGNVLSFNHAAERLSGHAAAEVRGSPSHALIANRSSDPLRDALAAGRAQRVESTLRTAAGKNVPIRLSISMLRDERGEVYGAIGEFADLSTIKALEAQVRHLDKLAALGRFTSSIAHEIRNPLAGITAGIQYLRKRMEGPAQEHVDFILAEVERMNRIIEDLLRAGRPLDLEPQDTNLVDLVQRSLRTLEPRFEAAEVHCERRIAPDLPPVPLDADRIEQVLINLIQNAVEASPAGSQVEIDVQLGNAETPFVASTATPDAALVRVRDRGEGIAAENLDKIFEPFFTTKARGTGLGLYVCHHIVEGHGGTIAVESAPGQGTCFVLCLPLGRIARGGRRETADLAGR